MAMRAKRIVVKLTFLKRLRQAGARVARLVKTAAGPSLIYGSDVTGMSPVQLNEMWKIARKFCPQKTYRRCLDLDLMLEDAVTDPGSRRATSAILMWQCAWGPALWMTKTLLAASVKLRDCLHPWKLVNGPALCTLCVLLLCCFVVLCCFVLCCCVVVVVLCCCVVVVGGGVGVGVVVVVVVVVMVG